MTGLLSVFSLLPVKALKKTEDVEGKVAEEPGGFEATTQAVGPHLTAQDDGGSSDKDAERYNRSHTIETLNERHFLCVSAVNKFENIRKI